MMVNWEFMDNMTPESATQLVDDLRAGAEVTSTRGPRIVTWREAERVLAGFPDGLVDEGPAAGPASLVGLGIARENGWTAPRRQADRDQAAEEPRTRTVTDTLTPVLTDNWDADRAWTLASYEDQRRLPRPEEGARHGPRRRSSRRSRTPACAAAAAPASRRA